MQNKIKILDINPLNVYISFTVILIPLVIQNRRVALPIREIRSVEATFRFCNFFLKSCYLISESLLSDIYRLIGSGLRIPRRLFHSPLKKIRRNSCKMRKTYWTEAPMSVMNLTVILETSPAGADAVSTKLHRGSLSYLTSSRTISGSVLL